MAEPCSLWAQWRVKAVGLGGGMVFLQVKGFLKHVCACEESFAVALAAASSVNKTATGRWIAAFFPNRLDFSLITRKLLAILPKPQQEQCVARCMVKLFSPWIICYFWPQWISFLLRLLSESSGLLLALLTSALTATPRSSLALQDTFAISAANNAYSHRLLIVNIM